MSLRTIVTHFASDFLQLRLFRGPYWCVEEELVKCWHVPFKLNLEQTVDVDGAE